MFIERSTFVFVLIEIVVSVPKQSIHIIEDLPIGTSIYKFSTDGCPTEMKTETYRFVDKQKNFNDFFLIDPYTGRITTKKLIDREEFCHRRMCSCAQCEITLEVLCVHQGQIFFNDLSIIIDDRNDHSPSFTKSRIDLEILENVPIGYLIPIDVAIDPDYGRNSVQFYQLYDDNSTNNTIQQAFQIEFSKKNDLLALRLVKELDREICSKLNYILEVFDGGVPEVRSTRIPVSIIILDVNDRSPIFQHGDLHLFLSESTPINTTITRVQATDQDTGMNGLVHYTIVSVEPTSSERYFYLDHETGELILRTSFDYEHEKVYHLKIKAHDSGPQKSSTPAYVHVHIDVEDENDNPPMITATFNMDLTAGVQHSIRTNTLRIRENTPNGTFLGHISMTDLDQGNNGRLTWTFESFQSIMIKTFADNDAFLMFTQQSFDREHRSQYEISLNVSDQGHPRLMTSFNFTLIIVDENDNRPKFEHNSYVVEVYENFPIDTVVIRFNATDDDDPETNNGRIVYRLEDSDQFRIDSNNGELRLAKKLDRETTAQYRLKIIASDLAEKNPLSTSIICDVYVLDVNDHPPRFDVSEYIFHVDENYPSDLPIGYLHATDLDENFSQLVYRWNVPLASQWPFKLSSNGSLYLKATSGGLDYERQSIYQCDALAIDNGGLQTRVPVTIYVDNRNDFCPELLMNSTILFVNTDLWYETNISFRFDLFDGDNDLCQMELLNHQDMFHLESKSFNRYELFIDQYPQREHYLVEFRLEDVINKTNDHACIRHIELIISVVNNQTNQTAASLLADEYFQTVQNQKKINQENDSSFQLMIINVILICLMFFMAIFSTLIGIKIFCSLSKQQHSTDDSNTNLYHCQAHTETRLPLLDQEPNEQLLMMNSHRSMSNSDNSQKIDENNRPTSTVSLRKAETFSLNRYVTVNRHRTNSPNLRTNQRDSGYDTKRSSSTVDDQALSVSYYSTSSSSNDLVLKTFSSRPKSDLLKSIRLAEQEIIDI